MLKSSTSKVKKYTKYNNKKKQAWLNNPKNGCLAEQQVAVMFEKIVTILESKSEWFYYKLLMFSCKNNNFIVVKIYKSRFFV